MYLTHIDLKFPIGEGIQWETSSFAPLNLAAVIVAAVEGTLAPILSNQLAILQVCRLGLTLFVCCIRTILVEIIRFYLIFSKLRTASQFIIFSTIPNSQLASEI